MRKKKEPLALASVFSKSLSLAKLSSVVDGRDVKNLCLKWYSQCVETLDQPLDKKT